MQEIDPEKYPVYEYPWTSLEERLKSGKLDRLDIVGFGSLINVSSAQRNFPAAPKPAIPLRVFGFQRVYDYNVRSGRYDQKPGSIDEYACALNCYPAQGHWLNGVQLELTPDLIEGFRQREKFYDLRPALACGWKDSEPDRVCYILSRKPLNDERQSRFYPHPHYHNVCTKGALDVSEDFLDGFQATTWYFDRKTKVSDRLCTSVSLLREFDY